MKKREIQIIDGIPEDGGYILATSKQIEEYLNVSEEPNPITLVLDKKKKIVVRLYVKEGTVIETQILMESFVGFGKKKKESEVKFRLAAYYREAWKKWVKRTEPKMRYKDIKYFHHDFNSVLGAIFPSPFDLFKEGSVGIEEEEEKNSEELSEELE